jgi:hypothetical protein
MLQKNIKPTLCMVYIGRSEHALLVSDFQLLFVQQLHEFRDQLIIVVILRLDQLLQLRIKLADSILGGAAFVCQRRDLFFKSICSGYSNACPIKELDGLIVVLFKRYCTQPLLNRKLSGPPISVTP